MDAQEFERAALFAAAYILRAPKRHQGWRLRIEALAKSENKLNQAIIAFNDARRAGKLDNKAILVQSIHIFHRTFKQIGPDRLGHSSAFDVKHWISLARAPDFDKRSLSQRIERDLERTNSAQIVRAGSSFADSLNSAHGGGESIIENLRASLIGCLSDRTDPTDLFLARLCLFVWSVLRRARFLSDRHKNLPELSRDIVERLAAYDFGDQPEFNPKSRRAVFSAVLRSLTRKPSPADSVSVPGSSAEQPSTPSVQAPQSKPTRGQVAEQSGGPARKPPQRKTGAEIVEKIKEISSLEDKQLARESLLRVAEELAATSRNHQYLHQVAIALSRLNGENRFLGGPYRVQAEAFARTALKHDPKIEGLWSELVLSHLARNEFDHAKSTLQKMQESLPSSQVAVLLHSMSARLQGDAERAISFAQQALSHQSADAFGPNLRLGEALFAAGSISGAQMAFEQAIAARPKNADAKQKHLDSLVLIGDLKRAQKIAVENPDLRRSPILSTRTLLNDKTLAASQLQLSEDGADLNPNAEAHHLSRAIENTPANWIIISRDKISEDHVSDLIDDRRDDVGIFYTTGSTRDVAARCPDIADASAIAVRKADLEVFSQAAPHETIQSVLYRVATVLTSQYIPSNPSNANRKLGLRGQSVNEQCVILSPLCSQEITADLDDAYRRTSKFDAFVRIVMTTAPKALVITPDDFTRFDLATRISIPIVLSVLPYQDQLTFAASSPQRQVLTRAIQRANAIICTSADFSHQLEDEFQIGICCSDSFIDGLARAEAFLKRRFLIKVGAGIGNMLQATPLIRWLSEMLNAPVDVCINSEVPKSHQLFADSRFVNIAYHINDTFRGKSYNDCFVASTMGATMHGCATDRIFVQRSTYDFYSVTKNKTEARYHFDGIWNLIGDEDDVKQVVMDPFIRSFDAAPQKNPLGKIKGSRIAIAGGKRGHLWGKRQWPHFDALAFALAADGAEVHSVGAPGEAIPGCIDQTDCSLRDSINLIRELDLFVGPDGGAFHIADALQIPGIVLFGPTSAIKNGPISSSFDVVRSDRNCAPCQFRIEFTQCARALCMSDISLESVRATIELKLKQTVESLPPSSSYIAKERERQSVTHREIYAAEYLQQSTELLSFARPGWESLFTNHMHHREYSRAKQVVESRISRNGLDNQAKLALARHAFATGNLDACLSYCDQFEGSAEDPWLFRSLKLRICAARHAWAEGAALWEEWRDEEAENGRETLAQADLRPYAAACKAAIRIFNFRDDHVTSKNIAMTLKAIAEIRENLAGDKIRLDDSAYRHPDVRFSDETPGKLGVAIVGDWSLRPSILSQFDPQIDVYALNLSEVTDKSLERVDIILAPTFGRESNPVTTIEGYAEARPHLEEPDRVWKVFLKSGSRPTQSQPSLESCIAETASAPSKTRKKRILIVAHHHLERDNPRGGERSTKAILERLKSQDFELMILARNEKTEEMGLEETELGKYIRVSHLVIENSLRATIACWRPDMVLTYGSTGIIAGKVCLDMNVPYIFFPRDWGEVCPPPHIGLSTKPRDSGAGSVYKAVYEGAHSIITNAKYVGKVIKQIYGAKSLNSYVPVLPPKNDDERVPLSERNEILLINAKKFQGGALVRALAEQRPDLKFRVVGGDDAPFPRNVTVEPFFNGANYAEMYRTARLFLFPLGEEDPCGTGRVIFEALMCETPCLSIDRGGMKEVLPKKWLLDSEEPEAWLGAIDRMLQEEPTAAEFEGIVSRFHFADQLEIVDAAIKKILL